MQQPNALLNVLVSGGEHVGLALNGKSTHTGVFLLFFLRTPTSTQIRNGERYIETTLYANAKEKG